jgi:hypothetical protein
MPASPALLADPDHVVAEFLAAAAPAEPEPVYLAWLLSLDMAHDPAEAAALLIDLYGAARPLVPRSVRLLAMLEDTTRWPRPALDALANARRKAAARS